MAAASTKPPAELDGPQDERQAELRGLSLGTYVASGLLSCMLRVPCTSHNRLAWSGLLSSHR